jgi:hypothetical protein
MRDPIQIVPIAKKGWDIAQVWSPSLASARPWIQTPVPPKQFFKIRSPPPVPALAIANSTCVCASTRACSCLPLFPIDYNLLVRPGILIYFVHCIRNTDKYLAHGRCLISVYWFYKLPQINSKNTNDLIEKWADLNSHFAKRKKKHNQSTHIQKEAWVC